VWAGQRVCPNALCKGHVFVVIGPNHELLESYPPELIDFDSSSIPSDIVESFEEAIKCHASQCFIASAIMVRKTLELLCAAQNVSGTNLKEKIAGLRTKVVLPPDLFLGLDDLRLLGNDAAHLESKVYQQVSQEEVEIAIELTKEVLKAVYQYGELLARMQALKKQSQGSSTTP
jgi:hypothetical protein